MNLKMIGVNEGLVLDRHGREKLDALGGGHSARAWNSNAAPIAISTATTMAAMANHST